MAQSWLWGSQIAVKKKENLATKTDIDDLVEKTDFDDKLKNLNAKVTSNKKKTYRDWKETDWSKVAQILEKGY